MADYTNEYDDWYGSRWTRKGEGKSWNPSDTRTLDIAKEIQRAMERVEANPILGRIERGELVPVDGHTRCPRDGSGRTLYAPCGEPIRVYHLAWSAMSCKCGETHDKDEYFAEVNATPKPTRCEFCRGSLRQHNIGRPRKYCEPCGEIVNREKARLRGMGITDPIRLGQEINRIAKRIRINIRNARAYAAFDETERLRKEASK